MSWPLSRVEKRENVSFDVAAQGGAGVWGIVLAGSIAGAFGLAVPCSLACNRPDASRPKAVLPQGTHATTIHQPTRLERLRLGDPTAATVPAATVSCDTCHSLRGARPLPDSMLRLQAFHQGLELKHGTLGCAACHAAGVLPKLHLADGRSLERSQAIELCAQCHGPQYRDYQHGTHGGMTGYWDLRLGPRVRNHCVDCHDPHAPAIRSVVPAPKPRDRFFGGAHQQAAHAELAGEAAR